MPFRNFTLEELARHVGMDARELRRLAERGSLPGQMVGGKWRFNRAEMLDWLQREMHALGAEHLQNLERAMSDQPDSTTIDALLLPQAVDVNLPARSRASLVRELVRLLDRTGLLYDAAGLLQAIKQREELCSTALPGGFAFPHPRRPLPGASAQPLIGLARVPAGVAFGAPDGRLTDLFVIVCCHDERTHLHTLARLALLFASDLPQQLRRAADNAEAFSLILESERTVLRDRE